MPPNKKKGKRGTKSASAEGAATQADLLAKIAELSETPKTDAEGECPSVDAAARVGSRALREVLADASTSEEQKLEQAAAEYAKMADIAKRLETEKAAAVRRAADRERLFTELQRTKSVKDKLEELCRSLQKQSKDVVVVEEAKRAELHEKFQSSLDDISSKLASQSQMQQDNAKLTHRCELMEKQAELKDAQAAAEGNARRLEAEMMQLELKKALAQLQASAAEQEKSARMEIELRGQLAAYTEKFEGFQDTLTSSNEMFGSLKKEMDKMNRKIKKLEREKMELRRKSEASDVTLIEMHSERAEQATQLAAAQKKTGQLESLCRTLQEQLKLARASQGKDADDQKANAESA